MVRGIDPALAIACQGEVIAALNQIVDPCSAGIGTPIGIADLGLVEAVAVDGGAVDVALTTTSPQCMFVGHFIEEAERVVGALPWVESVRVTLRYETMWDEARMNDGARAVLNDRYRRRSPMLTMNGDSA